MKKKTKTIIVISTCVLLIAAMLIYFFVLNKKEGKKQYAFLTKEEKTCGNKNLLYFDKETKINYYSYCLEEIKVEDKALEEMLKEKEITIEDMKNSMKLEKKEKEYSIYRDKEKKISMIACHSKKGNKDVYVGKENMSYMKDFCVEVTQNCYLLRTFKVQNIKSINEKEYEVYIKDGAQADTVRIDKEKLKNINSGDNVTISFKGDNNYETDETIEKVFKREIIEIKKVEEESEAKVICK